MGITYNIADAALLEGFTALAGTAKRRLTVISDQNQANVGVQFWAVVTPGLSIELQTELGNDPRYCATAEVSASNDPVLESQAQVRDDFGNIWKTLKREHNNAFPVNKYALVQVEEGLDS